MVILMYQQNASTFWAHSGRYVFVVSMMRSFTKQKFMFMITEILRRSWVLEPHPTLLLDASPPESTKPSYFVHHDLAVQKRDYLFVLARLNDVGSPRPWDGRLWNFATQSVLGGIFGRCRRCANTTWFRPNNRGSYGLIVSHVVEDWF
jgi:hypothetical protein